MRKFLKWLGIGFAAFVALLAVAMTAVYAITDNKFDTTYSVDVKPVVIPSDSASIEKGRHIAVTRSCNECHGREFQGNTVIDGPFFVGYLYAPNLTSGKGGVGGKRKDIDWVKAIRHGVSVENKTLVVMPSDEYYYMSDEDLGCLIAYLKSLPPVDNEVPETTIGPLFRTLYLKGDIAMAAERIKHTAPRPTAPSAGVSPEYGKYLAYSCIGCHGEGYGGGVIPGAPPDWKPAANISPGGAIAKWSEQDFIRTLRTGTTPDGRVLDSKIMPWPNIGQMTDTELKALLSYLRSLPAKPTGSR